MRSETTCESIRVEISARLDGEVDEATSHLIDDHLAECPSCRSYEHVVGNVRRSVRAQPAESVPDLSGAILEQVASAGPRARRRDLWGERTRFAALGAAAGAILVLGASLPFTDRPPGIVAAAEIVREIRAAAVEMTRYAAHFEIIEHGWHPQMPQRSFVAHISFEAPETLSLTLSDRSEYPSGSWPRNDVRVASNGRRWWIEEPATCPRQALPGCEVRQAPAQRTVIRRTPFDGSTALPTDIIVPLESVAAGEGLEVVGAERIGEHDAYRVALPYRNAIPLVHALLAAGSWREFHPSDRVEVWIDRDTWFPLRFEVRAARGAERAAWAHRHDYDENGGELLLDVQLASLSDTPDEVTVPSGGVVRDAGFRPRGFDRVPPAVLPRYTAELGRYLAGTTADGRRVATFARGLTWLKIVVADGRSPDLATVAEEIAFDDGRVAYYEPAGEMAKRKLTFYGAGSETVLETNLPRAELLKVAASLDVPGERLPAEMEGIGVVIERLDPRHAHAGTAGFTLRPAFVPAGYRPATALLTTAGDRETLTVHYRRAETEYDGFGIRITQSRPARRLAPSSEEFAYVDLAGTTARWSTERGELEWIDGATYRAVAVPSLGLEIAARIARGMR